MIGAIGASIQTHQSPHVDPNLAHLPTVVKTHNLHRCQNLHLQRNPPPMPCQNHYQSHLIPPLRKPQGLGSEESKEQMRMREGRERKEEK